MSRNLCVTIVDVIVGTVSLKIKKKKTILDRPVQMEKNNNE